MMKRSRSTRTAARSARWVIQMPPLQKRAIASLLDGACFAGAMAIAVALRHPENFAVKIDHYKWYLLIAPVVGVAAFGWLSVYRQIVRFTGLSEAWRMVQGAVLATIALTALSFFVRFDAPGVPTPGLSRVVFITFAMWALALTSGWRLAARAVLRPLRPARRASIVVVGAGAAASAVIADMARDRTRRVVAIVDDDRRMHRRELHGIRVWPTDQLARLIARLRVETVLLAVPSMPVERRRAVVEQIARSGARILTVPSLRELVEGLAPVEHLREVSIEDLLGRDPVTPDIGLLTRSITGRAVLVTGAGGSIGSELCRQIVRLRPRELVLLEQNEFALYTIERELRAVLAGLPAEAQPALRAQLGSVNDGVLMDLLLRNHRISTLYHAAACKHVPIVEENEVEGVRTNSFGTLVAARAAAAAGVERFVLISTDKAVRPTSVMGASKRLAEMTLQALQAEYPLTRYVMVRFGNVLGSSGSVVPLFRDQIRAGGPVTVTDAEMTRYFMTIPEAAELVLQAGALGAGGEVFVLDMGEPVKIIDLARRMIALAGRSVRDADRPDGEIEIKFTGLRPGEKLFEELVIGANLERTAHPGVMQAREDFLPWKQLETRLVELECCIDQRDSTGLRRMLRDMLAEYRPQSAPSEGARSTGQA